MKKILISLSLVLPTLLIIAVAVNTHTFQGMIIVPLIVTAAVILFTSIFEYFYPFKRNRLILYISLTCAGLLVASFLIKGKSEITLSHTDKKFKMNDTINYTVSTTTQRSKIITNNNYNMASTSTLSSRGETLSVSFIACSSADANFCFGDSTVSIEDAPQNVLMWSNLISTNYLLSFGIQSKVGNKWPYIVDIDFGGRAYDRKDYEFFKNKIPELFLETIKVSQ